MEVKRREFLDAKIKELKASVDKAVPFEDKLYNQPRLSDLVVSVGEQKFYVSKHQLAKKSPVFETMFLSDFKEAKEGVLNLHDEDPEAVEAMLKHIYMNTKIKDFELARRVVPLAHRYELLALKDECELILLEKVTFKSAIEVLYLANQLDLKLLFIKSSQVLYFESNLNNTEGTNQTDDKEIEHLCKCLSTPSGISTFPRYIDFYGRKVAKLRVINNNRHEIYFTDTSELSNSFYTVECSIPAKPVLHQNYHHVCSEAYFSLTIRRTEKQSDEKSGLLAWGFYKNKRYNLLEIPIVYH
uniref:BTB domain-containing protein n=1 Tax=Bursaphelenchus xylophilus TaxID=6326 RepID=A0A1I7SBP8_BURXY